MGVDFHLAYSQERKNPGREDASVKTIPKVVGRYTEKCAELAQALYGQVLYKIKVVSSCRAAEATKPFGFISFRHGPGLDIHCIPIDQFYLSWKARDLEKIHGLKNGW